MSVDVKSNPELQQYDLKLSELHPLLKDYFS